MKNPGIEIVIEVSDLAAPWLLAKMKNKPLHIEWSSLLTNYLYWTAQCPRVEDTKLIPKWHQLPISIAQFHHRRFNFFTPTKPQTIFSLLETRPWVKYVETLARQELYQYMSEVGQNDGYEMFRRKYNYTPECLDMEREIRTFHNHRSQGTVQMFSAFPFEMTVQ
ncbi:MAG: hypothetical protein LCH91_14035 [Bacteroidetes bacterium]|nr:hypothetical protein [Bacteroidota bacterium]